MKWTNHENKRKNKKKLIYTHKMRTSNVHILRFEYLWFLAMYT